MDNISGITLKKQYFLRELIGSGGMADVYIAWDQLRSTQVAVKALRRNLAEDQKFYRSFEKEASLLEKLEHPNIVRLYEFGREKDIVFLIMDWVEGRDLKKQMEAMKRPLSLTEVNHILQPLCSALSFAHKKQAYHCDIKPSNILLHKNKNDVLLADFGVARVAREQGGSGTLAYMAPEQFTRGNVSPQTDIYALGIMLYEMLSGGIQPYRGETGGKTTKERYAYEHINLPLPSLLELNPQAPKSIIPVIQKALSKKPADRQQSALEFFNAFEQARTQSKKKDSQETFFEGDFLLETQKSPKVLKESPLKPVASPGIPHLYARSGEMAGKVISAPSSAGLTIGRGSACHIQLRERSVSRLHATVFLTKRESFIRDEGSMLGTYLNGKRVRAHALEPIIHGDVVQIGSFEVFEIRLK